MTQSTGHPAVPRALPSRTSVIAKNSILMAADMGFALVGGILASALVARKFGPELLSHYSYVMWLVSITNTIGRFGMPGAVSRFMGEELGQGRERSAMNILATLFRVQLAISVVSVLLGIVIVRYSLPPEHFGFALIGVLALLPSMLMSLASNANMAQENFIPNTHASFVATVVNLTGVYCTVFLDWSLVGLAASLVLSRTADSMIRYGVLFRGRWRLLWELEPISPELRQRIFKFATNAFGMQILQLAVWDRSEMVFLKAFSDVKQIAFYSLPFNILSQLTYIYSAFSQASGSTMVRRETADPEGASRMVVTTLRYNLMMALPLTLGLAAVASPLMRVLYGSQYLEAIPVLTLSGILACAQAFHNPALQFVIVRERLDLMLRAMIAGCGIKLALAFALVPPLGALGAAACNGLTQVLTTIIGWTLICRILHVRLPWPALLRSGAAAVLMAAAAYGVTIWLPPVPGLVLGILTGAITYPLLLRYFRFLRPEDRSRFSLLGKKLPTAWKLRYERLLDMLFGGLHAPAV